MKKNLRNILALSLGLITTVAFAQDWNVDSRTRIDMSGDYDRMETAQRATLGVTFGGTDWGIHSSTRVNYALDNSSAASLAVYEAYASADLMGYASMTVGRQALEYGSGMIIGNNDWSASGYTRDGFVFGLDLDMADITLGYFNNMDGEELTNGSSAYYINAAKAEGDWSANLLYGSGKATADDVEGDATTMMGLDLSYSMMGGALTLDVMYNTASDGTTDQDMNSIGATYNVNDDMSISASQTSYGENGFNVIGGNAGIAGSNSWMSHGNIGHLGANQKNISIGGTYAMGNFNLGVTMHTIKDETTGADDYERKAMEVSFGYDLNSNAGLAVKYATDNNGTEVDTKYTWLTLTITP